MQYERAFSHFRGCARLCAIQVRQPIAYTTSERQNNSLGLGFDFNWFQLPLL